MSLSFQHERTETQRIPNTSIDMPVRIFRAFVHDGFLAAYVSELPDVGVCCANIFHWVDEETSGREVTEQEAEQAKTLFETRSADSLQLQRCEHGGFEIVPMKGKSR